MKYLLTLILAAGIAFFVAANSTPPPIHPTNLSASLPATPAVFETSLQAPISSSATTMTLTANSVRGGGTLSGYNCFTIDEGSAQAEYVCGTVSGTTVSSLTRGISPSTGTTTVSALQFSHRRGANVKITDFPSIQIMKAILNGEDTIPALMTYTNTLLCGVGSATTTLCPKYYIDNQVSAGAANSDETTKGLVEAATQVEMSSSTQAGSSGALLFVQSQYSTSSPYTTGRWNVITQNDGKITPQFIATSSIHTYLWGAFHTFSASTTFSATTTIAANSTTSRPLIINGIPYAFPTVLPSASSTSLFKDATGSMIWARPDFGICASTTVASATASTTLSGIPAATDLKLVVEIPSGGNDNIFVHMQFNGDTSGNYGWSVSDADGTNTAESSKNVIRLNPTFGAASYGYYITADISNPGTRGKNLLSRVAAIAAGTTFGHGSGHWTNASAVISSITLGMAGNLPAATRISVYCSTQ